VDFHLFTPNSSLDAALKLALILLGTFFAVRYALTRKTWLAPFIFIFLSALFLAPVFLQIDVWSEVSAFRPFLLLMILVFFILSPALEWLDQKRTEAVGQKNFKRAAHEIQLAFEALAREKIGALIAIEREDSLEAIAKKGIPLHGDITKEVLATLFTPYTPTHDGGAIIRDRKIAACGCVFPLSADEHMAKDLGTRHRAALGLSEKTDALVIIVSEESGEVSIASYGKLEHNTRPDHLEKKIIQELGKTHHKTDLHFPALLARRLHLSGNTSKSVTSFSKRLLLLSATVFFASLFMSFFPKNNLSMIPRVFIEGGRWDWIYAIPLLAAGFLIVRFLTGTQLAFHPETRQMGRFFTFLGFPLIKHEYIYGKLKGLEIVPSKKWRNYFELRLVKGRFKSWLVLESKNIEKLEKSRLALDPPQPVTNFGNPSISLQ